MGRTIRRDRETVEDRNSIREIRRRQAERRQRSAERGFKAFDDSGDYGQEYPEMPRPI